MDISISLTSSKQHQKVKTPEEKAKDKFMMKNIKQKISYFYDSILNHDKNIKEIQKELFDVDINLFPSLTPEDENGETIKNCNSLILIPTHENEYDNTYITNITEEIFNKLYDSKGFGIINIEINTNDIKETLYCKASGNKEITVNDVTTTHLYYFTNFNDTSCLIDITKTNEETTVFDINVTYNSETYLVDNELPSKVYTHVDTPEVIHTPHPTNDTVENMINNPENTVTISSTDEQGHAVTIPLDQNSTVEPVTNINDEQLTDTDGNIIILNEDDEDNGR